MAPEERQVADTEAVAGADMCERLVRVDLVQRLRSASLWRYGGQEVKHVMPTPELLAEAANEIERLQEATRA